jgi:hypothetical protein
MTTAVIPSQIVAGVTQVLRNDNPPGRDHIKPMKRSATGSNRSWRPSMGGASFGTRVHGDAIDAATLTEGGPSFSFSGEWSQR